MGAPSIIPGEQSQPDEDVAIAVEIVTEGGVGLVGTETAARPAGHGTATAAMFISDVKSFRTLFMDWRSKSLIKNYFSPRGCVNTASRLPVAGGDFSQPLIDNFAP